jgi:hypothetical protein
VGTPRVKKEEPLNHRPEPRLVFSIDQNIKPKPSKKSPIQLNNVERIASGPRKAMSRSLASKLDRRSTRKRNARSTASQLR